MLTSPASSPLASVTMVAALSGPVANVKPATRPVAAKARRVIGQPRESNSLSMSSSLEGFAVALDVSQRSGLIDAARDGPRQAIGRERTQPQHLAQTHAGNLALAGGQREDEIAVERRMHRTQAPRETVRRHDRDALQLDARQIGVGGDDGDGGVGARLARAFHVGGKIEIDAGEIARQPAAEFAVLLERVCPERIAARD